MAIRTSFQIHIVHTMHLHYHSITMTKLILLSRNLAHGIIFISFLPNGLKVEVTALANGSFSFGLKLKKYMFQISKEITTTKEQIYFILTCTIVVFVYSDFYSFLATIRFQFPFGSRPKSSILKKMNSFIASVVDKKTQKKNTICMNICHIDVCIFHLKSTCNMQFNWVS